MASWPLSTHEGVTPLPSVSQTEKKTARRTVAVEGNIGCGKTTFLNHFRGYSCVEVLAEPVAKWKNIMGYNALDLLYKDAERWSCAFEFMATLSMLDHHQSVKSPLGLKMMERSIYSTRHCFMEYFIQNDQIQALDQVILSEWHAWLSQNEEIDLDLFVYLRASPEICAERIKMRSREEEAAISLDYLKALHLLHDDWLLHGKRGKLPVPVLVLDANQSLEDLQNDIDSHKEEANHITALQLAGVVITGSMFAHSLLIHK